MRAVIMAGGEGSRLRPLTSLQPKPMVPIVNQPVMEHIIGLVKHHGITDIVATLAFMPQVIQDYFGDGEEWGTRMSYALEETPLGTAGSVKNAEALLAGDPFIVISGDALTDIDLTHVIEFHRSKGAAVTIALKSMPDPLEFGVVITDGNGRIERFLEKPSWGQVFSDTINTGIYVVEPEVLAHIPEGTPFDFSSELFPLLMEKGYPLYGCVVDGYWCDVGSFDSYMQAHRDVLDGEAKVYIPGVQTRERVWIDEGARIDEGVVIGDKVVIGPNVTLRTGAHVGDYTVLGDNCVIGTGANVSHSVLWSDTFLGRHSTVEGSVLCRHVDIRAGAAVDMNSVIGDETMVGHGARIGANVQVFPYKRIEPAAVVTSSIIWEATGSKSLFGEEGISGLVGVDITPEGSMRAAQAFGTMLPKGSHVVVSRDASRGARMVKRAMVAGLNAAGCHVRDLRVASPALTRFTVRDTRCAGGIHVAASVEDPQSLRMGFYDEDGLDIAPWSEKKVERLYFKGEFRRAFLEDVGEIMYPPRALEYYAAGLQKALEGSLPTEGAWIKVVADLGFGVSSLVLPRVASAWRVNMVALNPFIDAERMRSSAEEDSSWDVMRGMIGLYGADFGVRFDPMAERLALMTASGRVLDGDTALHALVDLWCRSDTTGKPLAVPLTASQVVEGIAAQTGHEVLRPGRTRRSLAVLAREGVVGFAGSTRGGYIFPRFLAAYDGVICVAMVSSMLACGGVGLDEIVDGLPAFYKGQESVFCPAHRKGAVMRAISEASSGADVDLTEGVRITEPGGWVLVLPHSSEPEVTLWAEGQDEASLARIIDRWTGVVKDAIGPE
ncbi:MAG: sugar phosphate nucleotidyltransferase [Anaerosomatales bacterium]|nr:sugar phosphate nucleotidyltransferase [Anaerosomatales bacterium]MDT8433303.1 sugar phosphate nucleotidyltransferase [Anaerosomatales bacterium]